MNKTYHIITIGCQMNKSDSERIAKYLEDLGFVWSDNKNNSDIVVLTTCGVRQTAEDRIYGFIPSIKANNPKVKIILTGCLVNREDVRKRLNNNVDYWLPITELANLANMLGLPKPVIPISDNGSYTGYLSLSAKYQSNYTAFVPIGNGCNNFCTYCVVPYARGRETYRNHNEILTEVKQLISKGVKEITLIAQNVNSYKSNGYDFADLLKLVDQIPGNFWLRFATSHPKDMGDKLISVIKNGNKICHHIHLPAQAGDNQVLMAMNRKYTIEHYLDLIKKIRISLPDVNLTTDIIVGFPNETEKQFKKTVKLFKNVKYDMAYVSQYSPRYGTASYRMEDNISAKEKKNREEELMNILRKTAKKNNRNYKGLVLKVLVDNIKNSFYMAHTSTNKTVRFKSEKKDLIGKFVNVKITDVVAFGLNAEIIN